MRMRPARHRDLPAIRALLVGAQLPDEDIAGYLATVIVGEQRRSIVATGALEPLGCTGLLRSVVVTRQFRGRGWGARIARRLVDHARRLGMTDVYLLTTTAADFFAAEGFKPVARESAPAAVQNTRQFSSLCPATAVLMQLSLDMLAPDPLRMVSGAQTQI